MLVSEAVHGLVRDALPGGFVDAALADRDDFPFHGLFLCGVGNYDPALLDLLEVHGLHHDPVTKRHDLHTFPPFSFVFNGLALSSEDCYLQEY